MIKGVILEVGKEPLEAPGFRHIDLYAYIGHKIGMSVPEIIADSEERFLIIEAEAVRDIVIMNAVEGGDVILTFPASTLDNPECARLLRDTL